MKRVRLFYLTLVVVFMVCLYEKEGLQSSQEAGAASILTGKTCSNLVVGVRLPLSASRPYTSNPDMSRLHRRSPLRTYIGSIEMLRRIPGPVFLVFFAILAGACIGIGWLWANADGTAQYPLPELTRFDPFGIAALRGGTAVVIQAAVFSLWNQKLVDISTSKSPWAGKKVEIKSVPRDRAQARSLPEKRRVLNPIEEEVSKYLQKAKFKVLDPVVKEVRKSLEKPNCQVKTVPPRKIVLRPIEEEVYRYLHASREPQDLFRDTSLKDRIEQHLEPVYKEQEELHLIRTAAEKAHVWMIAIAVVSVIVVIGGTKLYLGVTHNKPSGFLVLLLIGSLVGLLTIVKGTRLDTLTQLGRRYLKALEKHFAWLKESGELNKNFEGVDATLSIAIFGVGILAGAAMYETFSEAFPLTKAGFLGGGCGGGGCGGGCGGCGG